MGETSASGQGEARDTDAHWGKDGKEVEKKRVRNVARAYAWWIAKGELSLTILKVSSGWPLETPV
jgi:nucleolar MIF4G domain-containing protein 1